jgi:hypothetical protein
MTGTRRGGLDARLAIHRMDCCVYASKLPMVSDCPWEKLHIQSAPLTRYRQDYLEKKFPGYDSRQKDGSGKHGEAANDTLNVFNTLVKTILDQTVGAVVNTFLLCAFINFMKSVVVGSVSSGWEINYARVDWLFILNKAQEDFYPLLVAGWKLWPAVSLISFIFLRTAEGRNLFVALASVGWGIYISWLGVE